MNVLIVGAGIAGTTLAYWLHRAGHRPTLLEHAPQLRQGGYLIDFWGTGLEIAHRMGIASRLYELGYRVTELREVASSGRRIASVDPRIVLDLTNNRYVSIARSDLATAIYAALDDEIEAVFGDTISTLDDDGNRVRVTFEHGPTRDFDLVVGADGLHSTTRELVFGPEAQFERPLGITVAAFDVADYEPREELVGITHTEIGGQTLRFTLRDGGTMFFFTFRHDGPLPHDLPAQQQFLREHLRDFGWEVPRILNRLPDARTFYIDKASQIRMPSWSRGRTVLVGDAASCPSLLAGEGAALAMVQAYVLAAELSRHKDNHTAAFNAYHRQLAPLLGKKQKAALGTEIVFAPKNRRQLWLRNAMLKLMALPPLARLATRSMFRDSIDLPAPPAASSGCL